MRLIKSLSDMRKFAKPQFPCGAKKACTTKQQGKQEAAKKQVSPWKSLDVVKCRDGNTEWNIIQFEGFIMIISWLIRTFLYEAKERRQNVVHILDTIWQQKLTFSGCFSSQAGWCWNEYKGRWAEKINNCAEQWHLSLECLKQESKQGVSCKGCVHFELRYHFEKFYECQV